jgi:hypothetical protein
MKIELIILEDKTHRLDEDKDVFLADHVVKKGPAMEVDKVYLLNILHQVNKYYLIINTLVNQFCT